MITILVLTCSSLQVLIAHQRGSHYTKARTNYGQKCALSEKIKNRTKVSISGQWFVVPQGKVFRAPNFSYTLGNLFSYCLPNFRL